MAGLACCLLGSEVSGGLVSLSFFTYISLWEVDGVGEGGVEERGLSIVEW